VIGVVASTTVRSLLRRRTAIVILVAMPLVFYLARHDAIGQSVRSLVFGISWAMSTVAFFAAVAAHDVEPRLELAGARRSALLAGRLTGLLAVGAAISLAFFLLVAADRDVNSLGVVGLDFAVTAVVAVAFGTALGAVVGRELEGALVIFFVAGLQATVNPFTTAAKFLPFWSSRELATVSVDGAEAASLAGGLVHAAVVVGLCAAIFLAGSRGHAAIFDVKVSASHSA
jgi:uncharacterized membrane protein